MATPRRRRGAACWDTRMHNEQRATSASLVVHSVLASHHRCSTSDRHRCAHQRATWRMVVAGSQSVQAQAPLTHRPTHRSMHLSRLPAGAARALPSQLRLLSAHAVEASGDSASNNAAASKRVPPPPPRVSPASASTPSALAATFDKVYTAPRGPLPDVLKLLPQEVAAHCHASDEASTRWAELQSESELLEEGACWDSPPVCATC